jgi:hypothetical protein
MLNHPNWVIEKALGAMFILSSAGKMRAPKAFFRAVADYGVLPPQFSSPFGVIVMFAEAFSGAACLAGALLVIAVPLSLGLLVSFAVAVGINVAKRQDVPCYCFGRADERVSSRTLIRLALAIAGASVLLFKPHFPPYWVDPPSPVRDINDLVIGTVWVIIVLSVSLWLTYVQDLLRLFRRLLTLSADD